MSKLRKLIALLLSVCLLSGATLALAEAADATQAPDATATDEVTQAVAVTNPLADTDVVARVNGADVTGADVKEYYGYLVNSYGEPDDTSLDLYYAVAMEQAVLMKLIDQTAAEQGLDQYTDEEKATIYAQSDADWQAALDNYVQSMGTLTDSSTDEEKAAAYADAEAYFGNMGYDQEKLRQNYVENSTYDRVQSMVCKDVTVTDEEVQAQYDSKVAADKETYGTDAEAYETQLMMVQYGYATENPWYHPAGYRFIKHILLPVDSTLLSTYTDLQARLEEQMSDETSDATATPAADVTADPNATVEPTETPVTQADVDQAKADILASLSATTEEIYAKIAAGEDFDSLIAEYGVDADGAATDPGMTSGDYPNGYEVSTASSGYVPEFVEAAFSVDEVGGVSAPYLSSYGLHIVKYVADVPEGPVELTDARKESIREDLLSTKQNDAMTAWQNTAAVEYTGVIKSMAELQAAEDSEAADTTADTADTAAPEATETVAP